MSTVIARPSSAVVTEIKAMWQLAWPMLVGQLATVGMGVADVAMTGHVSAEELAAVSLGASVWSIVLVTVMGIMMAINTVVAHEMGAANYHLIPHSVRQALWKGLGVGAARRARRPTWRRCCSTISGSTQAVNDKASLFVHVISLGMPAFACYRALYGYTTSINQTKPVMVIAMFGLLFNVVVNWLLVFGNLGMPKLGAVGCAVATAAGMWLMLGAMIGVDARRARHTNRPFRSPTGSGRTGPRSAACCGSACRSASPTSPKSARSAAISLLVARFGVVQVSAHQIALNFSSLVFMVPLSFGIALITRVGQSLGEGNPRKARFVSWVGVAMSLAFGVVSAAGIAAVPLGDRARLHVRPGGAGTVRAAAAVRRRCSSCPTPTQVATSSAIRGYKVTRQPMVIQLVAFWVFSLPLGYVLGLAPAWFPWSPQAPMAVFGFWIGLVLGLTVAAVLLTMSLRQAGEPARAGAVTSSFTHYPSTSFPRRRDPC